ncbi:malonyl-ACP O-methyltransferase BioC [Acinetobacter cumulans]|uniref:malonyl-ACP O-methyltransferase BioC n=1 Tax=Acinetobacter cumulans TaxID=2136182 RepID=UPI00144470C7|nr:malonyl-ACP O-methyltransferase BioC [Acinetobacter cumulans]
MLDKSQIKQRFSKAVLTYDQQAVVQKRICTELAGLMDQYVGKKHWHQALEIGCGTGMFTQEVLKHCSIDTLYLNDLSENIVPLQDATFLQKTHTHLLMGDIEKQALPQNLDLVISSSALQWMSDLPQLFSKIYEALKPQGYFVFSSFGTENLREMKQLTGCGLDYFEIHLLQRFLMDCGFEFVMMKQEVQQLYFEHPRDVLQHIKATGVTATAQHRWTKSTLQQFYLDYAQFVHAPDSEDFQYPLTYHPIQCIVRKK